MVQVSTPPRMTINQSSSPCSDTHFAHDLPAREIEIAVHKARASSTTTDPHNVIQLDWNKYRHTRQWRARKQLHSRACLLVNVHTHMMGSSLGQTGASAIQSVQSIRMHPQTFMQLVRLSVTCSAVLYRVLRACSEVLSALPQPLQPGQPSQVHQNLRKFTRIDFTQTDPKCETNCGRGAQQQGPVSCRPRPTAVACGRHHTDRSPTFRITHCRDV